jgi:tRNA pseudouridine32 synthase/23S rRNA pseudouridine746 synthase/23S rRNA pseudouridine1911/1915/1917 synthase
LAPAAAILPTVLDLRERILYLDGLMLVVEKPAGIPVHGGPGGGAHLEQHFHNLRFGLPRPPALAHRLDRDTSGCLVLGRHPKALRRLGRLFASGLVEKTYWALVNGRPPDEEGRVDRPIAKRTDRFGWRMLVDQGGLAAVTEYRVVATDGDRSWLELRPRTGRTHQVRVHCLALGCPVVGDPLYGPAPAREPLQLHARGIVLPLYPNREPVSVIAPVPPHMRAPLSRFGDRLARSDEMASTPAVI